MIMQSTMTSGFNLLRDYIAQNSGIFLSEDKAYLLDTRLPAIMAEHHCSDFTALYHLALNDPSHRLRDKIIDAMTTNETLFFRDHHPFVILREKIVPALAQKLQAGTLSRLRIWSAASSTGQEAYSIAMTLRELCRTEKGLRPENIEIMATDISPTVLEFARAGRYNDSTVSRGLPPELKQRYFRRDGDTWIVDQEIKDMVTFQSFNLKDSPAPLGRFDIVFCRYVTIYFTEQLKAKVYENIARSLGPGNHLFISAVENLRGVSDAFEPLEHAGGTYYRCL